MARLGINIDHVATLRQARGGNEPDPVTAAALAELGGADGIVLHLREDRRHIQERDLRLLKATVKSTLNLEMAATGDMIKIAMEIQPHLATLVPERREELTTEGGLDVAERNNQLKDVVRTLHASEIPVSLFIDPSLDQVKAARKTEADAIEIHTGPYANATGPAAKKAELEAVEQCAKLASKLGLIVNAGHGLNYWNILEIRHIAEIEEYNIGHSIIARAVFVGLEQAVRDMRDLIP